MMKASSRMVLSTDSPLIESRRSAGSIALAYCIALPLFGRAVFPLLRDKANISFASSFTDPQIVTTYIAVVVVMIVFCRQNNRSLGRDGGRIGFAFMLFIATCLASASGSTFPLFVVWRSFEVLVLGMWAIVMIPNAIKTRDPLQAIRAFYAVSVAILLGVFIGLVINPSGAWAVEGEISRLTGTTGYSINPNDIGTIAAVLAAGCYMRAMELRSLKQGIATALFVVVCYVSYSRASYIALAIGFVVATAMLGRVASRRIAVLLVTFCAALAIVAVVLVSQETRDFLMFLVTRGHDATNLESFGGRLQLWELGLQVFGQHPFFGTGYGTYPPGLEGGHFHNVFIELLVTTGLVGTLTYVTFLVMLIATIKRAIRRTNRQLVVERIAAADLVTIPVIVLTANGATTGAAHYSWDLLGLISVAVAASAWLIGSRPAPERRAPPRPRFSNLMR